MVETEQRLSVLVPRPFAGPLDYRPPVGAERKSVPPGQVVQVPLGRGKSFGCVWDSPAMPEADPLPFSRLKHIQDVRWDIPPLPASLRRFIDWVAAYTLSPPGHVAAMALRAPLQAPPPRPRLGWVRAAPVPETLRLTPQRRAVLEASSQTVPQTTQALAERAGVGAGVVRSLGAAGGLCERVLPAGSADSGGTLSNGPQADFSPPVLSAEQQRAANALLARVQDGGFSVTLLEGVTGSGKTEVYFEAVAEVLRQNPTGQVLVLLPEIALTAQWTERFSQRFGGEVAVWHSALGARMRRDIWGAVAEGRIRVVVGARSALFLPFQALALVVVDEEHETSYKQEEGVIYHGRDMAVVRGQGAGAPVILASATPSLETLTNAQQGRYGHVVLSARYSGAAMPQTSLIDMRAAGPESGNFLSPVLVSAVGETLAAGQQAMLFLNRRGYAPLTLCRACGHRFRCPNCSAWLVTHRHRRELVCHHCNHREPIPLQCPHCSAEHALVPIGPGIERIREEAERCFPDARILCMASDILSSPAVMGEAVRKISSGEINLIIGTQMVAKGWHFPNLTLVGVVDADLGLGGGDLRAAERTMQLLHQVSGRAGRSEKPGRVMLQSYACEHPVMQALLTHDFNGFMAHEALQRQPGFWPPFGRLAAVIVSATQEKVAIEHAACLARVAPNIPGVQILGPAPAPLALLRGRWRQRLLLRTRKAIAVQPLLQQWLEAARKNGAFSDGVKIEVDIDPVSFM